MTNQNFIDHLRLPIIQSPMFIVSNARLVIASSKAGIIGSFPTANCRTLEALDQELVDVKEQLEEYINQNLSREEIDFLIGSEGFDDKEENNE